MYQETENGIFKPVLGALGVASVFLTIVGNLVFSPKPSSVPTSQIANTEQAPVPEQLRQVETAPTTKLAVLRRELAPQIVETIDTPSIEIPNSPGESGNEVSVAQQTPQPAPAPKTGETVVTLPLEGPALPPDTPSDILLAEKSPAAESVPLPEPSPIADERVAVLPVQPPATSHETANDNAPVDGRADSEILSPHDSGAQRLPEVADADNPPPVALEKLSHHERRLLRKAEHLAKKQIRLARHGRVIACR